MSETYKIGLKTKKITIDVPADISKESSDKLYRKIALECAFLGCKQSREYTQYEIPISQHILILNKKIREKTDFFRSSKDMPYDMIKFIGDEAEILVPPEGYYIQLVRFGETDD